MLLSQQDSEAGILHSTANAVASLGQFTTQGVFLDGQWRDIWPAGREDQPTGLPTIIAAGLNADGSDSRQVELAGAQWAYAYPLGTASRPSGYLVVGAEQSPGDGEEFLLRLLARQVGTALANVRTLDRERQQAAELRAATVALARTMKVHEALTRVALRGEGQDGIALALHQLTGRAVAIEDRFGNLWAWAGPGRPDPYPKLAREEQDRFVHQVMAAGRPIRSGQYLCSVALLGATPAGVLIVHDPGETAGETESVALEHAGTVLAMEVARIQNVAATDAHLPGNLVLDLIAGADRDEAVMLSRAQILGYDLDRPHQVLLIEAAPGTAAIDPLLYAVRRAVRRTGIGSLLAPRQRDVVVLADTATSWEEFRQIVDAGLQGTASRVGVGGRCRGPGELPRSYREAQLALRIQKEIGGSERVTIFAELGVYQLLAASGDVSAIEEFIQRWLGRLTDYDTVNGGQLVPTLSEYLHHGGSYDAAATALSVHRSTLKYRLRRIREVSGHDLSVPDTTFNLQLATRAWRTLHALRPS